MTDLIPPVPLTLGDTLTAAGIPGLTQGDVQNAISGYTGLSVASQNSLLAAASGVVSGGINVDTLTPLIAVGFASVGLAPIAAALTVGLPLVEAIASTLSSSPHCDWNIGAMCITQPLGPPYGPTDPRWRTFEQWYGEATVLANALPGTSIEDYIKGLESIRLPRDWPTPSTPQDVFLAVYRAVWRLNAEFLINGHNWVDPYQLLTSMQTVWNSTHEATSTYTFSNSDTNYIGYLLKGIYGEAQYYSLGDHPAVTINTGAAIPPPPQAVQVKALTLRLPQLGISTAAGSAVGSRMVSPQGPPSTTASSSGKSIVVGSLIVLGAGALGVGAWALLTHQSYLGALKGVWRASGGKLAAHVNPLPAVAMETFAEASSKSSTTVQTLLFPRPRYSESRAKAWASAHGYLAYKTDVKSNTIRIRQRDPSDFKKGSFRTISLGKSGVKAVIGHRR